MFKIKAYSYLFCITLVCFSFVHADKKAFKANPPSRTPFEMAAIAYASYEHHEHTANDVLRRLCVQNLEVKAHKEHHSKKDGGHKHGDFNTSIILVRDNLIGKLYVAIEGGHNSHDITEKDKENIFKIIKNVQESQGTPIAALIGHTRGGVLAKAIYEQNKGYFSATQVIGFNAPTQTDDGGYYYYTIPKHEINFACKDDNWKAAEKTLLNEAIEVNPPVLASSDKKKSMHCFIAALEGDNKGWKDLIK